MLQEQKSLLFYFSNVEDPRRLQGQRHELSLILLITLMSIMSGYIGYRAIGDFMKRNREELLAALKPKKGRLPSFDVIRKVLIDIDFKNFSTQFHNWAKQNISISKNEWISIDGKAIGGTVSNAHSINQDFVSLVSLYCSKQQLVFGNAQVTNSKESEIPVVKQLIEALNLKGVTFSLDALHCQKKQQK
jgi:DDE_Tnp_1-associated